MENRNIYKMDDALIIASFLMLIPTVFISWPWLVTLPRADDLSQFIQSAPGILGTRLNVALLYLGGAVLAQITGRVIRKQEKQALDVLDTILYMRNTTVDQLAMNLTMPRSKAEKIVKRLSRIRSLNIALLGNNVKIESISHVTGSSDYQRPEQTELNKPNESDQYINREAMKAESKDKSLGFQEKLSYLTQLAESEKSESRDKQESLKEMDPGVKKKLRRNTILIFILFLTPFWPVALIMVIFFVFKQARSGGISTQARKPEIESSGTL